MTKTNCLRPQNTHDIIQFECLEGVSRFLCDSSTSINVTPVEINL
jgi:hypothetical protein